MLAPICSDIPIKNTHTQWLPKMASKKNTKKYGKCLPRTLDFEVFDREGLQNKKVKLCQNGFILCSIWRLFSGSGQLRNAP